MSSKAGRAHLLESFLDVGIQLTQNLDIEQVLMAIVERSMELTGARYGAAATISKGAVEDFLQRGLTEEQVAVLPHYPEGKGLLGAVLNDQRPVRIEVISEHPSSIGFPNRHVPMDAFLGVPMLSRGNLVGAIYLTKSPGDQPFSQDDEELVTAMGSVAAVGIENARLFAAESERAQRATLFQEITYRVRNSLDTSAVLSQTVEAMGRALEADRCFIRLVEDEGGTVLGPVEFEYLASNMRSVADDADRQYPVSSLAAATRSTQSSQDVTVDDRLRLPDIPGEPEDLLAVDTRAVLATPLEWGGDLLGVLALHVREPRVWTGPDHTFVENVAHEVSVALHHARLYARALTTAEQLKKVDHQRSDFVSVLSHELRSPMTVVAGVADILRRRMDALSGEERTELLDILRREARRLAKLVSEVLDLEALERGVELLRAEVDLAELVRESIADCGVAERIELTVVSDHNLLFVDGDRVKQVLLNLLSNAAKFSPEDTRVRVTVAAGPRSMTISVADGGPGIALEDQSRLFERFSRLHTGIKAPGSGLGLYVSKTIVERHGGRIWVESEPGSGTTFSFELPLESAENGG